MNHVIFFILFASITARYVYCQEPPVSKASKLLFISAHCNGGGDGSIHDNAIQMFIQESNIPYDCEYGSVQANPALVKAYGAILVSESVLSQHVSMIFKESVPILTYERATFRYIPADSSFGWGEKELTIGEIEIVAPTSMLAANYNGVVTVLDSNGYLSSINKTGILASSARVIAKATFGNRMPSYFVFEKGDILADNTLAPSCRIGFFLSIAGRELNQAGKDMLLAAIKYSFNCGNNCQSPRPSNRSICKGETWTCDADQKLSPDAICKGGMWTCDTDLKPYPEANCEGGTWTAYNLPLVNDDIVIIKSVLISGDVSIDSSSTVTFRPGVILAVSGCVEINGKLFLEHETGINVTLFTFDDSSCVTVKDAEVILTSGETTCIDLEVTRNSIITRLCTSSTTPEQAKGLGVGAIVGLVLVCLFVLCIIVISLSVRKVREYVFPFRRSKPSAAAQQN